MIRKIILGAVLLTVLGSAATAGAGDIDDRVRNAERAQAEARVAVSDVLADLDRLQNEYARAERREARATEALLAVYQRRLVLKAELANARQILAGRARAAYKLGPATALEVILAATNPSELASAQAFTEAAFGSDADAIDLVLTKEDEVRANGQILTAQRKALRAEQTRLADLRAEIEQRLEEAEDTLRAAEKGLAEVRAEKRAIEEAARREAERQRAIEEAKEKQNFEGEADWDAIAACESGGNWGANTGNGYWGGLQFAPETWFGYGGGEFDGKGPFPYAREEQITVADKVLDSQGPGAWPHCFVAAS
ncbi:MAG TPA: transglycosylase family protein [Actinomycetota bacterium]|nr:transglycosylase family protein [Actinomycetota bacterium]